MNYYNYIESLEPNSSLKSRAENSVQNGITRKNVSSKRKSIACLSSVACFLLVATTVIASKTMSDVPKITQNNPGNAVVSSQTSGKIQLNTKSPDTKYGAQKIRIDNKVYVQYCTSGNKANWGEDNGNIEINEDDIGNRLLTVKAENIIDLENWFDYSSMTEEQAKKCTFNGAEVYEYTPCKNNTKLLVKTDTDYYFFYLTDFTEKLSFAKLLDVYTANGSNPIKQIDILNGGTISDKDKIDSLTSVLISCKDNYSINQIISRKISVDEKYQLAFVFDDGTKLELSVCKDFFSTEIRQLDDYGCYGFSASDYSEIENLLNNK